MITLLAKIFIKGKSIEDAGTRKAYGTLCSIVGILFNVLLFAGKYFAGYISGSIAIMADAFNNLSDAGSSFITLVGFWFAGKKPDMDHPFGHGRFEYISGLGVAVMILLMGFELAKNSVMKIVHPVTIDSGMIMIVILIVSIGIKLYMAVYNRRIGEKMDSTAMKATSVDSISDVAATTAVLISVLINRFARINLDGICGLIVSLFILFTGYKVVKETISPLLGQSPDKEFVKLIYNIVMEHKEIKGIHDLVVHDYGPGRVMISLHTEIPGDGDIFKIHDLIDRIENELYEKLGCEAVIHMDPIEVDNEIVNNMKKTVTSLVKQINDEMSIHDFRMVAGDTHTNLIFDVVVPYAVKESDEEMKKKIQEKISEHNKSYFAVIHVDRDYVR
ncbi:MAG: cation diffusion facilitator family transporter [Eubacterium sp.]